MLSISAFLNQRVATRQREVFSGRRKYFFQLANSTKQTNLIKNFKIVNNNKFVSVNLILKLKRNSIFKLFIVHSISNCWTYI